MEEIEIKIKIEEKNIETDLKYSDGVNLNMFVNALDALKSNYISAIKTYCENEGIDIQQYVKSATMSDFAKNL